MHLIIKNLLVLCYRGEHSHVYLMWPHWLSIKTGPKVPLNFMLIK